MNIDKTTFKATPNNYYAPDGVKTQIVIGFSFRKDHNHILRMVNREYGNSKYWNHFTVARDGKIFQHFNPKKHCDFLGIKEADKKLVSIVLENMGFLDFENGSYYNWINENCDAENVGVKKYGLFNNWEKFPQEQIDALVELCTNLCTEFNIQNKCIDFDVYNKSIIKFKGICFRSNYFEVGNVNPLFDLDEFKELLNKNC